MKHELDTEDFRSSLAGWIPILTTAAPDTHPEKHLIDDWVHFVSEKEAGSIAALGISPSCLAEAIRHGFVQTVASRMLSPSFEHEQRANWRSLSNGPPLASFPLPSSILDVKITVVSYPPH